MEFQLQGFEDDSADRVEELLRGIVARAGFYGDVTFLDRQKQGEMIIFYKISDVVEEDVRKSVKRAMRSFSITTIEMPEE